MVGSVEFQTRWDRLQAVENDKAAFVKELLSNMRVLESKLNATKLELEQQSDAVDRYKVKLGNIEHDLAQMSYISVLIDGDCMLFLDDWVKAGEQGGCQASRALKAAVLEQLRERAVHLPAHIKVVTRVYANLKGLSKQYHDIGFRDFGAFVNGFNKEDPLCDFVNAGDGKECADEKIKAMFQIGLCNVQCLHLVFGGSADNGYARLLGPLTESHKITLIEGPPFAWELAEIAPRFTVSKFPQIFRTSTQLAAPKASVGSTTSESPPARTSSATGYAAAICSPQTRNTPVPLPTGNASTALATFQIALNAAGQRVDLPLQCTPTEIRLMKARKLCNEFHLLGQCSYRNVDGKRCYFEHGTRVKGTSFEALRAVARHSLCYSGLSCRNPSCICGHQCPWVPCRRTGSNDCSFPAELHEVDITPASYDA